jgi:hypothetical protein
VIFLIVILTLVLVGLVVLVVSAPLRQPAALGDGIEASPSAQSGGHSAVAPAYAQEDLETAREAKYREIRDAELDYRTGKLSRADYEAIDTDLRAEALEMLDKLERLRPKDA